ncbi:sensor histidine kinase [Novosphingobium panipatense]
MIMLLPATIEIAVSQDAIRCASRLVASSALAAIHEILQNCRRAGAQNIMINLVEEDGRAFLDIHDDGCGIDDPAALLTLGLSGWGDDIMRREDPTGIDLFSLAGHGIEIHAFSPAMGEGWKVRIPAEAWNGDRALEPERCDLGWGTMVRIEISGNWKMGICSTIAEAARYYPLPVTLDGALLPREDFLKDALLIEEACGCRIGVYKGNSVRQDGPCINFHGLAVPCSLPNVFELKRQDCRWSVRIDVIDAPGIRLALPARNAVITNEAMKALRIAAERAIYTGIAAQEDHRLPFALWLRAQKFGVTLPAVRPGLSIWNPLSGDEHQRAANAKTAPETASGGALMLVPPLRSEIAQALAPARHQPPLQDFVLVEEERWLEGYDWYDALPIILYVSFRIYRDGIEHPYGEDDRLPCGFASGFVDRIVADLEIAETGHEDAPRHVHSIEIPALVCPTGSWDIEEAVVLVTRDGGIDPDCLGCMIHATLFSVRDDADADSWETQSRAFAREARQVATGVLLGDNAATLEAIVMEARQHLACLIPKDRRIVIHADRSGITADFMPG